jgi:hypothetical protein
MATIVLTFDVTAGQYAKLEKALNVTNAQRLPGDRYATIEDWLTDLMRRDVKGEIAKLREVDANEVSDSYKTASEATQDQIRVLLGLPEY